MQKIELYRIKRPSGGTDVAPNRPDGESFDILYRLIADKGMMLTNGERQGRCIDTDTPDEYTEVEYQKPATDEDYAKVGRILLGRE